MFTKNNQSQNSYKSVRNALGFRSVSDKRFNGVKLNTGSIAFICAVLIENIDTNDFCTLNRAREIAGGRLVNSDLVRKLIDLRLIEMPIAGKYVVTGEGEYFVRDIETRLNRMVENRPAKRWKKLNDQDKRLQYIRRNGKRGQKVVKSKMPRYIPVKERYSVFDRAA